MKLNNKIEKNYVYVSIAMLLLSIYVIFFPVIDRLIVRISPELTQCVYLKITGNPCPLCGGTRYFRNIGNAFSDISYLFHPFGIMFITILFEIGFRIYTIDRIRKHKNLKNMILFDISIHLIIAILFISYEIAFLLYR